MAQLEVIALDTAVPQLRAPAAGDTYSVPRDMTLASGTTLTAPTVDATTGNITTVNATTIDATNVEVTNVKAKDGTAAFTIADATGKVTVSTELAVDNLNLSGNAITSTNSNGNIALTPNGTGEVDISKVDIDSGAIDGTTIGGASAAAGTFTTATATTGNITTVNATTVDATNVEVTNVKAKDGTAAITIADSTGNVRLLNYVGVGNNPNPAYSGFNNGNFGTAAIAYGIHANNNIPPTATTIANLFHTWMSTASNGGTPYTLSSVSHYRTQQVTINADSTITNQHGYYADSSLTGATNNYGFYSNIASGTNRWNFYANGTADNYFGGPTTISVNSSSDALRITQVGAGNALLVEDASGDASPFVIDAAGRTVVGFSSAITTRVATTSVTPFMQVFDAGNGAYSAFRFAGASASPATQFFAKSRSGTTGTTGTVVVDGDGLMRISAAGDDGTQFTEAGRIEIQVDGTPGTNDMPGRLTFSTTADGSATPTEKMRIDNAGNVVVNTAAIATTATNGFLYVPSCAGTPTGTPTTYTGRVPIVVDTTNNKLYFYSNGTWRDAGP